MASRKSTEIVNKMFLSLSFTNDYLVVWTSEPFSFLPKVYKTTTFLLDELVSKEVTSECCKEQIDMKHKISFPIRNDST